MMSIGSGMSPGSGPNSRMSVGLYSTSVYSLVACAVNAMIGHGLHQVVEIRVQHHVGHVVVVEACSAQLGVAQVETQRLHQMQDGAGHRAQADGRAGVAGNAR